MWLLIGFALLVSGLAVLLYKQGKIDKDLALQLVFKCTQYIREAEILHPEPGSGNRKKEYVLSFLRDLFADVSDKLLSQLIDLIVAILNAMHWW